MVDPDDDEDNLWYDDDADRFPPRYDDEYDDFEGEDSFGEEDEFVYDDGSNNDHDRGVEMQDTDFLDNNAPQDDPKNSGGMVPFSDPNDPYAQYDNNASTAINSGGAVPHANLDNPYAQYSQRTPPQGTRTVTHADPNDPYAQPPQQDGDVVLHADPDDPYVRPSPQVGDKDGPELI